jgi:hypothetical protein
MCCALPWQYTSLVAVMVIVSITPISNLLQRQIFYIHTARREGKIKQLLE